MLFVSTGPTTHATRTCFILYCNDSSWAWRLLQTLTHKNSRRMAPIRLSFVHVQHLTRTHLCFVIFLLLHYLNCHFTSSRWSMPRRQGIAIVMCLFRDAGPLDAGTLRATHLYNSMFLLRGCHRPRTFQPRCRVAQKCPVERRRNIYVMIRKSNIRYSRSEDPSSRLCQAILLFHASSL